MVNEYSSCSGGDFVYLVCQADTIKRIISCVLPPNGHLEFQIILIILEC